MNAKEEFVEHVSDKVILCAIVLREENYDNKKPVAVLSVGFTEAEYNIFLNALNFEYNSGYGGQELFGNIWYKDGTWSDRGEYDGSEWWQHQQVPEIPKECGEAEITHNSAMPKCLCKGWFSVRNILIQQCGTCGGIISQRTSA